MSNIPIFTRGEFDQKIEIQSDFPRLPIIPKTEYYGRIPFEQAFDVLQILQLAAETRQLPYGSTMYVVDFASRAKVEADCNLLFHLDKAAHHEAMESEGFLLYFRGDKDPGGYTRSFCVWESMVHAKIASGKPKHLKAAAVAEQMYDFYSVTMREARLTPTINGYEFSDPIVHTVGQDDPFLSIAATALNGIRLQPVSDRQLPLSS